MFPNAMDEEASRVEGEWLSDSLFGAGKGVEPPRGCLRRILSFRVSP
jgi:hypothetical protein